MGSAAEPRPLLPPAAGSGPWSGDWVSRMALSGILATAFLLRLPGLDRPVWFDELWSTHVKLGDLLTLANTVLYDAHPPFYAIFMSVWNAVFGDGQVSIRVPPLVFGMATILATYALAARLADRATALLAAWLLGVSPAHIWYSLEARPYAATVFFLVLATLAYERLGEGTALRLWRLVYGVSLTAAAASHYYVCAFALLISVLCLVSGRGEQRRVLPWNIAILMSVGAFLALKSAFHLPAEMEHLRAFDVIELWMLFLSWFVSGNSIWPLRPPVSPFSLLRDPLLVVTHLFFAAISIRGLWRAVADARVPSRGSINIPLYAFTLPLGLAAVALVAPRKVYGERSLLILLPFFLVLLAMGLTGFRRRWVAVTCLVGTIGINLVALAAFFVRNDEQTVATPRADWPAAARYLLREHATVGAPVFVLAASQSNALSYYDPRIVEWFDRADLRETAREKTSSLTRVLGRDTPLTAYLLSEIRQGYEVKQERIVNAGVLILYARRERGDLYARLGANPSPVFYVLRNERWLRDFDRLWERVARDPRFALLAVHPVEGMQVFKWRLKPYDAGTAPGPVPAPSPRGPRSAAGPAPSP